jgi:hypothetical protein
MIFGAPIRSQRVTKPCFRNCSNRRSRSKPPLCLCTRQLVSDQPEGSVGRLRYLLGGDRPSQTTRLTRSPQRITHRVSYPTCPGWCSIGARLLALPPTLYKTCRAATLGCSKAPWGLSVLPRVMRIFTHATISPSLSSRQRPSRYAIRAGRNLPDKEFRYLRTVIVTAAIHQCFDSELRPDMPA